MGRASRIASHRPRKSPGARRRRGPVPVRAARTGAVLLAAALLGGGAAGCRQAAGPDGAGALRGSPPRLVILYATCTLNKRYLSPYNPGIPFTPGLERFSRESVVFDKHRTEAGMSGIAFASIFSGMQARGHGIFTHPTRLRDSVYLIGEHFRDHGYETWFWGGHSMAGPGLNYGQGVPPSNSFERPLLAGDPAFKEILEDLRRNEDRRVFIMTNFTATHSPYSAAPLPSFCRAYPRECRALSGMSAEEITRFDRLNRSNMPAFKYNFAETAERVGLTGEALRRFTSLVEVMYRANVNRLDYMFSQVVDAVDQAGLAGEAVIAFTADHGETLYGDSSIFYWSHAFTLQSDVLDVPLIVRAPGAGLSPGRAGFVTRSIDVFPTLSGLAGIPPPGEAGLAGVDLTEDLLGGGPPPDLLAYSHTGMVPPTLAAQPERTTGYLKSFYPAPDIRLAWVGVRRKDMVWKYRRLAAGGWAFQAFDLSADPQENENLFDPGLPEHHEMALALQDYKASLVSAHEAIAGEGKGISPEEETERLRSLGYIE